jgi:hypothetical protein
MAFDASPSWSGFNYQGKVALYHALTLINAKPIDHDFSTTHLMLEANEDFEIIIADSPISFHQVKAYNSNTFSEYSDALFGLTIELYKHEGVAGYIHSWKTINDRPNCEGLLESVKNDFDTVLKEYRDAEPKTGASIIEKAASGGGKLTKKSSILRAALPDHDAEQLAAIIEAIVQQESDALDRLECYPYDDGNTYCDLGDINTKIKHQLSIALNARRIMITEEQLEKALNYFFGIIDGYIIQRHKAKTTTTPDPITFMEIIAALNFDHEDVSTLYVACRFKERFSYLIDEYLGDDFDYPQPVPVVPCNLKAAQKTLLLLSPSELWEHYRYFSPQLLLESANNLDNAFSVSDEGIRHCLLKILHSIDFSRISQDSERYRLSYKCASSPPQSYLPTTITTVGRVSHTVRQLNSNPCLSELLFEVRNLIYCGNEVHPFTPDFEKSTRAPRSTEGETRMKRDDTLPEITLLPLQNAKDALTK